MAQAATDYQLALAPLPLQATITVPQSLSAWPAIIESQAAQP